MLDRFRPKYLTLKHDFTYNAIVHDLKEQYIGVDDINGKEAYVGDKVKYKDIAGIEQIGIIRDLGYKNMIIALGGDDEGNQDAEIHPDEMFEIVGNIHQPEVK